MPICYATLLHSVAERGPGLAPLYGVDGWFLGVVVVERRRLALTGNGRFDGGAARLAQRRATRSSRSSMSHGFAVAVRLTSCASSAWYATLTASGSARVRSWPRPPHHGPGRRRTRALLLPVDSHATATLLPSARRVGPS